MKISSQASTGKKIAGWASCMALIFLFAGSHKGTETAKLTVTTVGSCLQGVMGVDVQSNGTMWVSERGTANNDGKVLVIKRLSLEDGLFVLFGRTIQSSRVAFFCRLNDNNRNQGYYFRFISTPLF